jgi:glyoxylase-like metal-dependent hydrolase (beta-lactamase superfamily II)
MALTRRDFLLYAAAAPLLHDPFVGGDPVFSRGFARSSQLAPGVFATISDTSKGLQCYSNGGVIAGRDATLIVEGHYEAAGAELELEIARTVAKAPLLGVVNTHYHLDHTFGNIGYARHGVRIIAHDRVGPLMKERYTPLSADGRTAALAPWQQRLAAAETPTDRAHREGDLRIVTWILDSIEHVALTQPTEALAPADLPKRIDLGGLTAVIEFHSGHSPTDLIIGIPERNVVFTGDLFFNRAYPVIADADILAWRKILDVFLTYDRRTQFVPGHGQVGTVARVHEQTNVLDHLREHAERMIKLGVSVEEAERRYAVPHAFEGYDMLCWNGTVGGAMRTYYAALAQTTGSETLASRRSPIS